MKVVAFISRPSFRLYRFILNFIHWLLYRANLALETVLRQKFVDCTYKVWQSVARPEIPISVLELTLKTLWKLQSTVISWVDRRVSVAIATQFLPFMAIIEFPLYWSCTNTINYQLSSPKKDRCLDPIRSIHPLRPTIVA